MNEWMNEWIDSEIRMHGKYGKNSENEEVQDQAI